MQNRKLCFNDILLVPQYSELDSRTVPSVATNLGWLKLKIPIISAPMDSITGKEMIVAMDKLGGLGILTRYINMPDGKELSRQIEEIQWAKDCGAINIGCAIGIKGNVKRKAELLLNAGCGVVCLDVAHGDYSPMYSAIDQLTELKDRYSFVLMAGNVCTPNAAYKFANHGVDAIKVGIGGGSCCTTRTITGFGYPELAAVQDAYSSIRNKFPNTSIICDGGIRSTGDMVKSFWAGADAVMLGYLLGGTSATPKINGQRTMRGMSSRLVSNRFDVAPEGIEIKIKDRGKTENIISDYIKGIKSGLSMGGAKNISELRNRVNHVVVSSLCMEETLPVISP